MTDLQRDAWIRMARTAVIEAAAAWRHATLEDVERTEFELVASVDNLRELTALPSHHLDGATK